MNRYKMRFSAMYPAPIESGPFDVSRIRSSTMMELVSYMDLMTQLNLKRVNRYFRKLVKISHSRVSLAANAGWVDAIHLSTFLKEITPENCEKFVKAFWEQSELPLTDDVSENCSQYVKFYEDWWNEERPPFPNEW